MESFRREDYVFDLPEELIAQKAVEPRDASRLLVARRQGAAEHISFCEIGRFLKEGDVLVLNQTKVMNARCRGYKDTGTPIEVFVLNIQAAPGEIPVLLKPAKRVKPGTIIYFRQSGTQAQVVGKSEGQALLSFASMDALLQTIEKDGEIPLPPYIKRPDGVSQADGERYQTVYAKDLGAVAAPTAGLHFTPDLLAKLKSEGIQTCFITHHVGIGTFKPIVAEDIRTHVMDEESYLISEPAAELLNQAKQENRRIIAVGTTSTRCLESNFHKGFHPGKFATGAYIFPGYQFKALNGLITNFHLPGSTLILLVSALMGRERMLDLYREAVEQRYRFYSYGDAMLLFP